MGSVPQVSLGCVYNDTVLPQLVKDKFWMFQLHLKLCSVAQRSTRAQDGIGTQEWITIVEIRLVIVAKMWFRRGV